MSFGLHANTAYCIDWETAKSLAQQEAEKIEVVLERHGVDIDFLCRFIGSESVTPEPDDLLADELREAWDKFFSAVFDQRGLDLYPFHLSQDEIMGGNAEPGSWFEIVEAVKFNKRAKKIAAKIVQMNWVSGG